MPNRDQTGPAGQGQGTGKRMGPCFGGSGMGRGMGCRRREGFGHRCGRAFPTALETSAEELASLEQAEKLAQEQLEAIRKRKAQLKA
jgi:hypothetical protein